MMEDLIQNTFIVGGILTAVVLVISVLAVRFTPAKSYIGYFPGFISFGAGLILLLFATLFDRIWVFGTGLGGLGIACLFAGAASLMVAALVDTARQPDVQ